MFQLGKFLEQIAMQEQYKAKVLTKNKILQHAEPKLHNT